MSQSADRRQPILDDLEACSAEPGHPPTIREIGAQCEIPSTSVVACHLMRLAADGDVEREGAASRGKCPVRRRRLSSAGMKVHLAMIAGALGVKQEDAA